MILVKTWLERVSNVSIGSPSVGVVSVVLLDLVFFRICFMCHFSVAMEGGRFLIRFTVRLGHVDNRPFSMAWSKVFLTGINNVARYHCTSSGLVLSVRELIAAGCLWLGGWSGVLVSLTFHMPGVFDQVLSNRVSPPLTTLRLLEVKVSANPSPHSFLIDTRNPYFRWYKMCAALDVRVRRGFIFRNSLWVVSVRLPPGSSIWGNFFTGFLLLHGLINLI